jgi:hypothetical protein
MLRIKPIRLLKVLETDNTSDTGRLAGVKGYDCTNNRRRIETHSCHREVAGQEGNPLCSNG